MTSAIYSTQNTGATIGAPSIPAGAAVSTYSQASTTGAGSPMLKNAALQALRRSDVQMTRIEGAVIRGANTYTSADVVAWETYRHALRLIIEGTDTVSVALPAVPAYAAGT